MQEKIEKELLEFWLGTINGLGIHKIEILLKNFKSIYAVFEAGREQLLKISGLNGKEIQLLIDSREKAEYRKEWERLKAAGIQYYSYWGGKEYPDRLRHIYQPPKHLYVRGRLPDSSRITVGIVGARDCTCYGRDMARMFGYRLAEAGVQIISGMARGIDGWAHQGALESGGQTYAVLGCGVEVCYPAVHRKLYESISRQGGVISELPPRIPAQPQFFPLRNRIISGLSDGILVVEARERSGSLITADAALEQGRDVFVIPGRIGDTLSVGCNRLIRQGAVPVTSPADILEYYKLNPTNNIEEKLSETESNILEKMSSVPVHIDEIVALLKTDETSVFKGLLKLKREKRVRETSRGYFIKLTD